MKSKSDIQLEFDKVLNSIGLIQSEVNLIEQAGGLSMTTDYKALADELEALASHPPPGPWKRGPDWYSWNSMKPGDTAHSIDGYGHGNCIKIVARLDGKEYPPGAAATDLIVGLANNLPDILSALRRVEEMEDRIEGLTADLFDAVQTAHGRGATEWARLNYSKWIERIEANAAARSALKGTST